VLFTAPLLPRAVLWQIPIPLPEKTMRRAWPRTQRGSMYTDKINPAKRTPGAAALCAAVLDRTRFFLPFGQNAKKNYRNGHGNSKRSRMASAFVWLLEHFYHFIRVSSARTRRVNHIRHISFSTEIRDEKNLRFMVKRRNILSRHNSPRMLIIF